MASETILVDNIVARACERLINTSTVPTELDTRLRWACDDAIRSYVSETRPQDFITTATKSIVAGTSEYACPDDFFEFMPDGVRFDSTDYRKLSYMTREQYDRMGFERMQATGNPIYYIPEYRKASDASFYYKLWPTPSANFTLRLYYRAIPTSVRATTSGDGTYLDKRLPTMMVHRLIEGIIMQFPDYLDAGTLAWAEKRWQDAIRLGKDSSTKQAGEPLIPDEMSGARRFEEGPIPPLTLS